MFVKLSALFYLLAQVNSKISNCGAGRSLCQINALGFWPDPAIRKENSTLSYDYTVPDGTELKEGTVKYSIVYNFLPLNPTIKDLCTQTPCPILPGNY